MGQELKICLSFAMQSKYCQPERDRSGCAARDDPVGCPHCGQRALKFVVLQRNGVRHKAPPDKP